MMNVPDEPSVGQSPRAVIGPRNQIIRCVFVGLALLFCLFALSPLSAQTEMKKGMEMKEGMKMEMATDGIFEGRGKVIALVPEKSQIVMEHEEIKGFMKAMPMGMGYAVESAELLEGLNLKDPIKFKIDAAKKKIIAIERLK